MSNIETEFERLLITGATGFIGRHLIEFLKETEKIKNFRIMVRKSSDKNIIEHYRKIIPGIEIIIGDIQDLTDTKSAVSDCDAVINLAAKVTYKNDPDLFSINVNGVKNLCNSCSNSGIKKFLHVSSTAALGYSDYMDDLRNEDSSFKLSGKGYYYAESKYEADEIVLDYFNRSGLPVVICMPAEVYGEYGWETAKNLVDLIKFPVAWNGGTSVVYVKDVAEGIIKSLFNGRSGEKYILGGDNLTIEEITKLILGISETNKKVLKIPNFIINHPVKYLSIIMEKFNVEPIFDSSVIKYATKYWFVESKKAKKELDFNPVPPEVVFSKTIKWLKEKKAI